VLQTARRVDRVPQRVVETSLDVRNRRPKFWKYASLSPRSVAVRSTKKGRSKGAALVNADNCVEATSHTHQSAHLPAGNNRDKHTSTRSCERLCLAWTSLESLNYSVAVKYFLRLMDVNTSAKVCKKFSAKNFLDRTTGPALYNHTCAKRYFSANEVRAFDDESHDPITDQFLRLTRTDVQSQPAYVAIIQRERTPAPKSQSKTREN